ncbi:MAG: tRNA (N(6)-L-threonylcarbamoyladenosine(37)-C(2))-methylthiotransferase MtaB [candidate division Zixibacteria bacterium]
MPKAAITFTGCRLNRYEIQTISESLELCGFEIVPFEDKADVYIINTCGVTGKAEVSSRNLIRRARRTGPNAKVIVTGCYSELKGAEMRGIGADLVVSNDRKENMRGEIIDLLGESAGDIAHEEFSEFGSWIISGMGDLTRGFIKIQEGCDRKCTYCTIWMSRGEVRSRKAEFIVEEINNLHDNGYKEVVLTGVHIGMYSYNGMNFSGLLRHLLANTGIPRIRLSSLFPTEVDDKLIELLATNNRICPHLHLSVQSGDDSVLEAMGRGYDRVRLIAIIKRLNDSVPKITIGADIITGFPGESEDAFQNSIDLVEESGLHHLHVFTFSPRPNTPAAAMEGQIPPEAKKKRTRILRGVGRKLKEEHLRRFLGADLQALFENRVSVRESLLTGISENYLRIEAVGPEDLKGEIVDVVPYKINGDILLSKIVLRENK